MKPVISTDKQKGIVLLEGLIAILIFSLGILSIVGLQAVNLKQTTDAKYRVDASYIANQTLGMMWANPANMVSSQGQVAGLPNGSRTVVVAPVAADVNLVTVTITWQLPGEPTGHSHVVTAQINQ